MTISYLPHIADIRMRVTAPSLENAAYQLVDAANQAGGRDNIAVGLLRVFERLSIPT